MRKKSTLLQTFPHRLLLFLWVGITILIVTFFLTTLVNPGSYQKSSIFTMLKDDDCVRASFSSHAFSLKVARSLKAKQKGLSEISNLAQNSGMLFVFLKPDKYGFWMYRTWVKLDIIYLKHKGKNEAYVVDIIKNPPSCKVKPCPVYTPAEPADLVLELPAGECRCKPGDVLTFKKCDSR